MSEQPVTPTPAQLQEVAELDAAVVQVSDALRRAGVVLSLRPAQATLILSLSALMVQGHTFADTMTYAAAAWDALKEQVRKAIEEATFAALPVSPTLHG